MILYGEPLSRGFVKLTPTQLAKLLVGQKGRNAEYWEEDELIPVERMTDHEREAVDVAIERQIERVHDFLGYDAIHDKAFGTPDVPGEGID